MFTGSNNVTMDSKGRLAIPAKIRDALVESCGGRIVVTAHTEDRCVLVYPEQEWAELKEKIAALPNMNAKARRIQRLVLGYAQPLELDGNGRVLLPQTLRDYAQLEKKLMLVGQNNKLELWSEALWNSWVDEDDPEGDVPDAVNALSL
ncbi:division/cell wall cluster transcriptional repressor MraZ [Litorivivens sp.]|uniref:division/cell wall cluster transcriptional repressor MraZ n=1 Tax=Litorivivens sp. TaxID=2020868 RepID=UPI0035660625